LSGVGFDAFGASACATVGAGILVAAGGDASCAGGAADAAESSLYSHAEPIAGTRPKMVNAVAVNTRFMVSSPYVIVPTAQFALNENACQQGVRIAPETT
jgi:hypothetical protein